MISIEELYRLAKEEFGEFTIYKNISEIYYYLFWLCGILIVGSVLTLALDFHPYTVKIIMCIALVGLIIIGGVLTRKVKKYVFSAEAYRHYDIQFAFYTYRKKKVLDFLEQKKINPKDIPYEELIKALESQSSYNKRNLVDLGIILAFGVPIWNWYLKEAVKNTDIWTILIVMSIILFIIFFTKNFIVYPIYKFLNIKSRLFDDLTLIFREFQYTYTSNETNNDKNV